MRSKGKSCAEHSATDDYKTQTTCCLSTYTVTPACIRQKPYVSVLNYRTGQAAHLRAIAEGVRSEPGSPASKQAKSGTQLAGPVLAARPGNLPVQISGVHESPHPCSTIQYDCTTPVHAYEHDNASICPCSCLFTQPGRCAGQCLHSDCSVRSGTFPAESLTHHDLTNRRHGKRSCS